DSIQIGKAVVFDFDFSARAWTLRVDSYLGRQCSSQLSFGRANVWIECLRGFRQRCFPLVEILNSLLSLADRPSVFDDLLCEAPLSYRIVYTEERSRMAE